MKVLFASLYCLLDPSSGSAISCRLILEGLAARGHSAQAISSIIFGRPQFSSPKQFLQHVKARPLGAVSSQRPKLWELERNGVTYLISPSQAQQRMNMTCGEENYFQNAFKALVEKVHPDIVLAKGQGLLERDNFRWLKDRKIPIAFYLANPSHHSADNFRDVSLIVSDSEATAELYKKRFNLDVRPVGKFITPVALDTNAQRDCVTFINPSPEKGAVLFIGIVREAMRRGLSAKFLVIESRGKLIRALQALGFTKDDFPNIEYLPLQEDMNNVWSRTRVLLSPSLWHESGPRTIIEASSAGIPVLATNSGGATEFLGEAAFLFPVPSEVKENFLNPIKLETAKKWVDVLEKLLTDESFAMRASERVSDRWQVLKQRDPIVKLEKLLQGVLAGKREEVRA